MQRIGSLAILLVAITFLLVPPIEVSAATASETDSWKFSDEGTTAPHILHVSGDVYAIVYEQHSESNFGKLITVNISSTGVITKTPLPNGEYTFQSNNYAYEPEIVRVDSTRFVIAYGTQPEGDAIVWKTVEISNAGAIDTSNSVSTITGGVSKTTVGANLAKIDDNTIVTVYQTSGGVTAHSHDVSSDSISSGTSSGSIGSFRDPHMTAVDSDTFAYVYSDNDNDRGKIAVFEGPANGNLVAGDEATFNAGGDIFLPKILAIDSDTFAIIYQSSSPNGLLLKTIDISATGNIDGAAAATIKGSKTIDTSDDFTPDMTAVDSDTIAIAYGKTNTLSFKTLDITAEGVPSSTFNQELDISVGSFPFPKIIKVSDTVFAIVHGASGDGYLRTITIPAEVTSTPPPPKSGGDNTPPTIGKSPTGRQVVENGFSYQSNLGGFTQLDADLGLTHMDSLKVAVGGLPPDAPPDPNAPPQPDVPPAPPGEIPDDVREKLQERGLGDVAQTFDNISDALEKLDNFFNRPPPTDEPPGEAPPEPQEISDVLDNLKEGLDQSRINPDSHPNPEQATQINNLLDKIAQKIEEIEDAI